jgi:hypothetical protein
MEESVRTVLVIAMDPSFVHAALESGDVSLLLGGRLP